MNFVNASMPYPPKNLIAENRFVLNLIDLSYSIAVAPTLVMRKKEREKKGTIN